jgi:hypothetical protein
LNLIDFIFIQQPENPRLSSLGMNGTRSEAEANRLSGPKPRALARGVASFSSLSQVVFVDVIADAA